MGKTVQISRELFIMIARYHLGRNAEEKKQLERVIMRGLEEKLNAMARHEQYTMYQTADTPEEREKAKQNYLKLIDIPENEWC